VRAPQLYGQSQQLNQRMQAPSAMLRASAKVSEGSGKQQAIQMLEEALQRLQCDDAPAEASVARSSRRHVWPPSARHRTSNRLAFKMLVQFCVLRLIVYRQPLICLSISGITSG